MPALIRKAHSKRVIRLLLICIVLYGVACGALMMGERTLLYVPFAGPTEPAIAGLPQYSKGQFTSTDGTAIPYWEHAETEGPLVLYFHGNGGGLHAFISPLDWLADHGMHVIAMEYRGYPGAPGTPSEKALVGDAVALIDHLRAAYPQRPIALWGYSLGSGVATQAAAARTPTALVLEAPFSATVDRARQLFPLFPVRWLMRDQFLSREYIGTVKAPILILHGDADTIIPIGLSEQLYDHATEPKTFRRYAGAGHFDLVDYGAYADALAFIGTLAK